MSQKRVDLPRFERVAQFRAESFNADDNTIEIVWTTGASVRRYDYWDGTEYDEVLSLDPGAVRLDRLNLGAPYLNSHCSYGLENVIGSVVPGSAKIADGLGTCRILLSRAAGDADIVQKIKDGVIRNNSVGYWIHKTIKTEGDDGTVARWDVVDWEPLEISAVPIPADPGSQIRSTDTTQDGKGPALRSCVLVTEPRNPAAGPTLKARKETPMATPRTRKTAPKNSPKNAAERLAELEAENKRLADLIAAKRDGEDDGDKKDDEDQDESRDDKADEDEDKKSDDERDGDDADADDERDGDEEDEDKTDKKDEDERSASGKGAGKRESMTSADVRKAAEAAVRADRIRGAKIREIATQFGFPNLGERHASGETSVRAFKDLVLERLADRQKKRGNTTFAAAGTPEVDETAARSAGKPTQGRDFDKGATEMRALLGKV